MVCVVTPVVEINFKNLVGFPGILMKNWGEFEKSIKGRRTNAAVSQGVRQYIEGVVKHDDTDY
jgi:hypothetical protein